MAGAGLFRIILTLALVIAPLRADAPSEQESRMVDLNVVALDIHGEPVTDLARDEFRISDSGKPQTIAFFRHRDSPHGRVPALQPNEFSNRSHANIPRATLILFDLMNETFATRGFTASRLVHDLGSLETADFVYLYLLTVDGRLFPVHGLPGGQAEADPGGDEPWTSRIKPLLDQALRKVQQSRPVEVDIAMRVQMTYLALSSIAAELSRVPGRKSIVWLTDGVPIELGPNRSDTGDFLDFTPLLRQMSEALDRSGVAIYPVRQVMLGSPDNVNGAGSGIGSVETLNEFAELTGGRPDAGKDISTALRQAVNDTRTSYQIGYYPPAKNWDNKFHKLRVTCTRKGVHIQSKTGYYAWRQAPGAKSEQAINSAISTTFDAAEIGLRATLSPSPKGERMVRIDAHIDAQDIVLIHDGDKYNGHLRLAIVGYVPGVEPARGPLIPLDIEYGEQDHDKALKQGIGFVEDLTLEENMQAFRLIVFDRASNAIGSVTIPVPAASNSPAPKY